MNDGPLAVAAQWHQRGVQRQNSGAPVPAVKALTRALALLDRPGTADRAEAARLRARIWITLALCRADMEGLDAGHATLAHARDLVDDLGDPAVQVAFHTQAGLIDFRFGDMRRAVVEYDAAERLIEHAAPNIRLSIYLSRGALHLQLGDLAAARKDLREAVRVAAEGQFDVGRFKALHNLAYLEFLQGDLPLALRLMDEVGAIEADVSRGIWLLDRSRVLSEAGLIREADEDLAAAAAILRGDRLTQDLAECELERARCALARDDARTARRLAAAARGRFGGRGNARWRRSAELVMLQADLAQGRARRVAEPAGRLRAELADEGLRLPARIAGLLEVEALLAAGRGEAARAALADVGDSRPGDPITGRMHSHYVHARVEAETGRPGAATRRVRRALDDLARYQASFGSIDLRTAAAVHGRRLAELDVRLAWNTGRPAALFAAAERARAVSSRLPAVRPPDDPVAADLLAELRQTLEALRGVEQDRTASAPLLRRRRELERRIAARSWSRAGSGAAARPAPLAAVRQCLADRTMVMYVQAAGRLAAVVVGPRLRLQELGAAGPVVEHVRRARADLDVLANPRLPGPIRGAVRSSLHRSLTALYGALVAPLDLDGPLVVVSTGVLGQLPWASLPGFAGCPITVAPSATKWLAAAAGAPPRPGPVLALAGPDLGRGADEAAAVGRAWTGAAVETGSAATTARLLDGMGAASILHVAAHGVHQPENPLFSSVRMADGPVFAHELDRSHRAPEHVVLSACEVGLATIRPGDEALGLASVLLQLGTRSVVAGVARVGDEVAEQAMAGYHARLAKGADSAAALADALADVDTDVVPPFVNFGAAWAADLEPAVAFA